METMKQKILDAMSSTIADKTLANESTDEIVKCIKASTKVIDVLNN